MKEYIYVCNIFILVIKYEIEREVNCFFVYNLCLCDLCLYVYLDKENYENCNLRCLLVCYYFYLLLRKK